jgi:hypothetical protein
MPHLNKDKLILSPLRPFLILGVFLVATTCRAGTVTATLGYATDSQSVVVNINDGHGTTRFSSENLLEPATWRQNKAGNNPAVANLFSSFSIDLSHPIQSGTTYTYTVQSLATAPIPGSSHTIPPNAIGAAKADAIERLWNGFFSNTMSHTDAAAFQLAIWRIEYDWAAGQTAASLENFRGGNFRASGSANTSGAAAITEAQGLLANVFAGQGLYGIDASGLFALTSPDAQNQIAQARFQSTFAPAPSTPEPTSMCLALVGGLTLSVVGYRRRSQLAV